MPVGLVIESLAQCRRVDEVAIVGHADTVGAVDVEGLSLSVRAAAGGRVSQVAEAHEAGEVGHACAVLEDTRRHTVALALVEATTSTATDYSGSILAAMLEEVEGIVHLDRSRLRLGIAVDHSNDTAHFDVMAGCGEAWSKNSGLYATKTRQLR